MTTQDKNYFNLHTTGIGYLNDIREITPKRNPFLACRISALVGSAGRCRISFF